jgi:hypothetical protein
MRSGPGELAVFGCPRPHERRAVERLVRRRHDPILTHATDTKATYGRAAGEAQYLEPSHDKRHCRLRSDRRRRDGFDPVFLRSASGRATTRSKGADRQDALDIAIQLTGESQIRIELLGEALLRDEPQEEIDRLKEKQEDAAIEWRKEVPRLLLLARDLLSDAEYDRFRMNIETRLKKEKLDPLRRCLNEAYARAGDIDAVKRTIEQCRFEERKKAVADCTEALLGGLHQMTAAVGAVNREMDEARRQELGEQVSQACT